MKLTLKNKRAEIIDELCAVIECDTYWEHMNKLELIALYNGVVNGECQ